MLQLQDGISVDEFEGDCGEDEESTDSFEDCVNGVGLGRPSGNLGTPYVRGDLQVISFGNYYYF